MTSYYPHRASSRLAVTLDNFSDIEEMSEQLFTDTGSISLEASHPPQLATPKSTKNRSGWRNPKLTRLGLYYPLDETSNNTIQFSVEKLPEMLSRLQTAFRNCSLDVVYQNSPVAAACYSMEQVEFRVCLWKSRTDAKCVRLEMQRRAGDVIHFSRHARQIFAEVMTADPSFCGPAFPPVAEGATSADARGRKHCIQESDEESSDAILSAVAIAHDLLVTSDRYDAAQLGLESLCFLTDPVKVGLTTAATVSRLILLGESPQSAGILRKLVNHTVSSGSDDDGSMRMDDDMDLEEEDFGFETETDRNSFLGLVVLCSALKILLIRDNPLSVVIKQRFFEGAGVNLLETLLDKVRGAAHRPHQAYHAAQALAALCHAFPTEKRETKQASLVQVAAQHAQQVGVARHAALESASRKLIQALQA